MEYKGYIIKSYPKSPNLKIIVTAGQGGKIPKALSGAHLSEKDCKLIIDGYKEKVSNNAKAKPTASKL